MCSWQRFNLLRQGNFVHRNAVDYLLEDMLEFNLGLLTVALIIA